MIYESDLKKESIEQAFEKALGIVFRNESLMKVRRGNPLQIFREENEENYFDTCIMPVKMSIAFANAIGKEVGLKLDVIEAGMVIGLNIVVDARNSFITNNEFALTRYEDLNRVKNELYADFKSNTGNIRISWRCTAPVEEEK